MKKIARFPIPDPLIHAPQPYELFLDSIIMSVYDSDENKEWEEYELEVEAPPNS